MEQNRNMPRGREGLSLRLSALIGFWLKVECCRGAMYLPIRLLLDQRGDVVLATVVPRLRCSRCGGRPTSARLSETPHAGAVLGTELL